MRTFPSFPSEKKKCSPVRVRAHDEGALGESPDFLERTRDAVGVASELDR
jgi:hypothetical protein